MNIDLRKIAMRVDHEGVVVNWTNINYITPKDITTTTVGNNNSKLAVSFIWKYKLQEKEKIINMVFKTWKEFDLIFYRLGYFKINDVYINLNRILFIEDAKNEEGSEYNISFYFMDGLVHRMKCDVLSWQNIKHNNIMSGSI